MLPCDGQETAKSSLLAIFRHFPAAIGELMVLG